MATIVSSEVAADAAEPPEAAVLSSVPCMVVAPSNALPACHVTVEGTIVKLSETSDGTAVEPLEVAASAAEPPEVSVVYTYQSLVLPCHGYGGPSMNPRPALSRLWRPSMILVLPCHGYGGRL